MAALAGRRRRRWRGGARAGVRFIAGAGGRGLGWQWRGPAAAAHVRARDRRGPAGAAVRGDGRAGTLLAHAPAFAHRARARRTLPPVVGGTGARGRGRLTRATPVAARASLAASC